MSDNLVLLSDNIIRHSELHSFQDILAAILFQIDLKPDYADTPRNWASDQEV
ncbi:MAG: hypothetical protein VCD50_02295 [Alphaproteobacteria bacterium]|jgi:hypothetical protein